MAIFHEEIKTYGFEKQNINKYFIFDMMNQ